MREEGDTDASGSVGPLGARADQSCVGLDDEPTRSLYGTVTPRERATEEALLHPATRTHAPLRKVTNMTLIILVSSDLEAPPTLNEEATPSAIRCVSYSRTLNLEFVLLTAPSFSDNS